MSLSPDLDLSAIAQQTSLYSGADLEHLCREAALEALTTRGFDSQCVCREDFETVLGNLKSSIDEDMIRQYEEFSKTG